MFCSCPGHENFRARIGPDANRRIECQSRQLAPFGLRCFYGRENAALSFVRPRRFPRVNARWRGQKLINLRGGRTAKDVDLEFLLRSADEGQAHHGIAEMVEFDNKQTRFHRENQRRFSR